MFEVKNLKVTYGDMVAVHDISFSIHAGEVFCLLGVNGAGKTSTIMSIMGIVTPASGGITMHGTDISHTAIDRRIHHGISLVPEGRRIFTNLTVEENLIVGGHILPTGDLRGQIDRIYSYFPRLQHRHNQCAGSLSGGEQQMLAMGRALLSRPKLLVVDELSLGLMPAVVDVCYNVIKRICKDGVAVLLVDQNTETAISVADRICVLEAGNVIWTGSAKDAGKDKNFKNCVMGIDG